MNRRSFLVGSATGFTTFVAGCLESEFGGGNGDENGGEDGDESETGSVDGEDGTDDGTGDIDDLSIDGRLHNESAEPRTFAVTIRDEDGEIVAEDERVVDADSTENVPAFGRPGEPRTFEVAVGEAEASVTLEFDVESERGRKDGHVDVTYAEDGSLEIAFAATVDGTETGDGTDDPEADPLEPPRDVVLENDREDDHAVAVVVTRGGEALVDGEYAVEAGSETRIEAVADVEGEYLIEATIDGDSEVYEWIVTEEVFDAYVVLDPDELWITEDVA